MPAPYNFNNTFPFYQPQITPPPSPAATTAIPPLVYRVHRKSAQTRYSFSTGFSAKNHATIVNHTVSLSRFGLAHLHQQTNISSPFISVYDNLDHAENVARWIAQKYGESTSVVTVDTNHLARGPVFRAADLFKGDGVAEPGNGKGRGKAVDKEEAECLHHGEYLVMYRIPTQAIRMETPVVKWRTVGVIGKR